MIFDRWTLLEPAGSTLAIASRVLRSMARRRGVTDSESQRRFFEPQIGDLHPPALIHGMAGACERIERAVHDRESILIYGDYDVDGVTSIVLLRTVLKRLGADAGWVVPHRLVDGYGLKTEVIERVLRENDVRLIITVDCGISSVDPVRRALERGIDVIVTDHHLPPGTLPEAAALLNPKIDGCAYPFKDLAGVGVAFKLCCELLRRANSSVQIDSLLKITAIGTIADVAPLVGENRAIAKLGLAGLHTSNNPGLRMLLRLAGLEGRPPSAGDIGFKIGPRINAAGRLASADTAIDLFSAKSEDEAWKIVLELNRLNAHRQDVERALLEDAEQTIAGMGPVPRVIVLAKEGWHRGVVGLCAGRLAQKYHRPTLVIAVENGRAVGSGRSIPSIHLHAALDAQRDLFEHFGGHEFACGFSLDATRVDELRERLLADFNARDASVFAREIELEGELPLRYIDEPFVGELERFEPFGAGNPQPQFLARGVSIATVREFAEECFEAELREDETIVRALLWRSRSALRGALEPGNRVDLVYHAARDSYRGGARVEIVDVAPAGAAPLSERNHTESC